MEKIKYFLLSPILVILLMSGCSIQELETWNEKGRVWFTSTDVVLASFKTQPASATEMTAEIRISLAGNIVAQDREITVDVLKDARNSATRYEVQHPVMVAAGADSAVLKVKVYKTDNLADNADTVNFIIRSSAQLEAGIADNLQCSLVITNKYARPWWWYDFRCGIYSERKHEVLFEVFNSDKDIRGAGTDPNYLRNWTVADALYNLYLLNKHCEEKGYTFRFADGK